MSKPAPAKPPGIAPSSVLKHVTVAARRPPAREKDAVLQSPSARTLVPVTMVMHPNTKLARRQNTRPTLLFCAEAKSLSALCGYSRTMSREEHVVTCAFYGDPSPETCAECERLESPVWFTKSGKAYHVNPDCPSLHKLMADTTELKRQPRYRMRPGLQGCHQCVNGICVPCSNGKHEKCNPEGSDLEECRCPHTS